MYIKVAKDCFVPEDNIKFYLAYSGNAVRQMIVRLRQEEKVLDLSGKRKASTVVLLKTGEAILTSLTVDTITTRTESGK